MGPSPPAILITQPEQLAAAAADAGQISTAIGAARAAAAGPTTNLVAAAEDEVSAIAAVLFGAYGQECQALLRQATEFNEGFVAALAAAGNAYAAAEAAASNLLGGNAVPAAVAGALATAPAAAPGDPITTLVLGGSGNPIPGQPYISQVVSNFITNPLFNPLFPFDPSRVQALNTPEGYYPFTGIKDLTVGVSISRGVTILDQAIQSAVAGGNTANVLGYSQSAVIASLEMRALNPSDTPGGSAIPFGHLNFTLLGDPMNPNGGLLERFVGLTIPSGGLDFYGATPGNSFPTKIFTQEYDGYADFPLYPIDFVSDLNAFFGSAFVHGSYPILTATQLDTAITLPTAGDTTTTYYMIPTPNLPLLEPVRAIPFIGNPIADLVQPDLRVLVDLGYGSTTQGWSTGPANVPTPFGVIPPVSPGAVVSALAAGTPQGFSAFMSDVSAEAQALSQPSLPSLTSMESGGMGGGSSLLPAGLASALSSPDNFIQALESANTAIANGISNGAANTYAVLLPTADIANALVTSIPSYNINLFLNGVEQVVNGDPVGGLVYAFGAPVAADVALGMLSGGFELEVLLNATGFNL
jgi:hypothetical protein